MGGVVNNVRERRKYYFSVEKICRLPIHISNVANVCCLLKYRYLLLNNTSNLKYLGTSKDGLLHTNIQIASGTKCKGFC